MFDKKTEKNKFILNNINVDAKLNLTFQIQDKQFEFPVRVIDVDEEYIYINVIKIQDKILGFTNSSVKVNLILPLENERPIIWENIELKTLYYKNKKQSVYQISNKIGKQYNRRGNFRIPIMIQADAQMGLHKTVEKVIVKDISSTGISILVDKNYNCKIQDELHVVFYDPALSKKINITCYVMREQQLKNGQYVYGCKFKEESDSIMKYIQEKQRKDLQRMSGKLK